jgi:hypothetical protein
MPAHTPSPRRFLAPAPPPSAQKPRPKLLSSLRHGFTAQEPAQTPAPISSRHARTKSGEEPRATPARRFVFGPSQARTLQSKDQIIENNGGREQREAEEPWIHTQATPRVKPPPFDKVESTDESSPSSSANVVDEHGVLPSVEQTSLFPTGIDQPMAEKEVENEEEILFVSEERSKRRRITPQSEPPSSPSSYLHTPTAASHRFKAPPPRTPATCDDHSSTSAAPDTRRPHFILPRSSPSPSKSVTPLPETFSPSRKNGKFVPAGLASTLQSWIVETAEAGYSARHGGAAGVIWGKDREDGVKMRVRVIEVRGTKKSDDGAVECWAGGVVFVRGSTDVGLYNASRTSNVFSHNSSADGASEGGAEDTTIVLAGQGAARGKAGVRVREGTVIGIRAPVWDVNIKNCPGGTSKCVVAVEWVVLF